MGSGMEQKLQVGTTKKSVGKLKECLIPIKKMLSENDIIVIAAVIEHENNEILNEVSDHIMDLADYDKDHRQRSIDELKRVIEVARKLKTYFPKTKKPLSHCCYFRSC